MKGGSEGTCPGACCAVFPLTDAYRTLIPRMAVDEGSGLSRDNAFIRDMLIPLTVAEARERQQRFFGDKAHLSILEPGNEQQLDGYGLYTCRHWDEDTRLCTVYADRPLMCRAYPYGSACERGCGFELSTDDADEWRNRAKPAASQSPFEWDEQRAGWTIRSTPEFEWDEPAQLLRAVPAAEP